jgi:hypothetical protein
MQAGATKTTVSDGGPDGACAPVQTVFERLAIVLEGLSEVAARLERLGVSESAAADGRYIERAQDIDRIVQGLSDTARFVRVLSDVRPCADTLELDRALKAVGQAALASQLAGAALEEPDSGDFEMF